MPLILINVIGTSHVILFLPNIKVNIISTISLLKNSITRKDIEMPTGKHQNASTWISIDTNNNNF